MPEINIRGQTVHVDVEAELRQFEWTRPTWNADKLIAASPFRFDRSPSFFVRLEPYAQYPAGTWADAGAYDAEFSSGNLTKLLSFLRNETYEETEEYLLDTYGFLVSNTEIKLKPVKLRVQRSRQSLNDVVLASYAEDYAYLESRGISAEIQRQAGVKYDAQNKAVVIPWRLADGRLANVKYRKTFGKAFWYERGAWPIRELVYGIEQAAETTVLCEAEIDALSWRMAGYAAIAVGGASFNEFKRDVILRSKVDELLIATDNDKAGEKLREEIAYYLRGRVGLRDVYVDSRVKDANEALVKLGAESLRKSVSQSESVRCLYVKTRTFGLGKRT